MKKRKELPLVGYMSFGRIRDNELCFPKHSINLSTKAMVQMIEPGPKKTIREIAMDLTLKTVSTFTDLPKDDSLFSLEPGIKMTTGGIPLSKFQIRQIRDNLDLLKLPESILKKVFIFTGCIFDEVYGSADVIVFYERDNSMTPFARLLKESERAKYPGGIKALREFLKTNIKCPTKIKKMDMKIRVTLFLKRDGFIRLERTKVLYDFDFGCKRKIMSAISKMPKWKPFKIGKRPIEGQVDLIIKFLAGKVDVEIV